MADFIVKNVVKTLKKKHGDDIRDTRVLILGFSFKENCPDVRNTKIFDLYNSMKHYTQNVTVFDPVVDVKLVKHIYKFDINTLPLQINSHKYDAIILGVPHSAFKDIDLKSLLKPDGFVYDTRGFFKDSENEGIEIERI